MKLINVELKLIAPLQYYSTQSAGGMRTAPFIGDIALTYSMAHSMGIIDYPPADRFKPDYREITDLPFLFTVAVPESLLKYGEWTAEYMKQMTRNTMMGIDYNGTNTYPGYRVGSNMYKNFYFVQMMKPSNDFTFNVGLILKDDNFSFLPNALRVGNSKTGILSLSYRETNPNFNYYINRYTLENIYEKKLPDLNFETVYHPVHQYQIFGPISGEQVLSVFES
jgi:CRISPR-associated protein Csc1